MNEQIEQTIFSDLSNLEMTLTEDKSGDRARAMISYFGEVAKESVALMQASQVAAERQLVAQLIEAFYASQRVIHKVWEALHGCALTV
jgi:hypothetical protein